MEDQNELRGMAPNREIPSEYNNVESLYSWVLVRLNECNSRLWNFSCKYNHRFSQCHRMFLLGYEMGTLNTRRITCLPSIHMTDLELRTIMDKLRDLKDKTKELIEAIDELWGEQDEDENDWFENNENNDNNE